MLCFFDRSVQMLRKLYVDDKAQSAALSNIFMRDFLPVIC